MTALVLGATGRVGPHVVEHLLLEGAQVRVLARSPERAAAVLPAGVDVRQGDLTSDDAVRAAVEGVDSVFLLTPHGPAMAETQLRVLDVVRSSAPGARVVKLSGTSAGIRPDGPDACAQHWRVEQELQQGGGPFVVLRPNAFMQGLVLALAAAARSTGVVADPLAGAGLALVDCADIGACAAVAMLDGRHDGRTFALTGPTAPTYAEIAGHLAAVLGRDVVVRESDPRAAGAAACAAGASAWEGAHLAEMLELFRQGGAAEVTDDVPVLLGRPARAVSDLVRATVPALQPS
ncbi:MAG: Nmr family protein [Frankiales bacterium]|nr:Nmr family protein [Frankiales bacterium]